MGQDAPNDPNKFYTEAETYYQGLYGSGPNTHIAHVRTLQAVLELVETNVNPVGTLIIVSHGHPDGRLMFDLGVTPDAPPDVQLPVSATGGTPTQFDTTKLAVDQRKLSTPRAHSIDAQTKIVIKGCNIGRSPRMVAELSQAFGGRAEVMASTHAQEFGGGQEHLAEYFVERPGHALLATTALSAEFQSKYGSHIAGMTKKDWNSIARRASRQQDDQQFEVFRGITPPPATDKDFRTAFAQQLAELKTQGARDITFTRRTKVNGQYHYEFGFKKLVAGGKAQAITSNIIVDLPPDNDTALAAVKHDSGRPDAYDYKVVRSTSGPATIVEVKLTRTEWKLRHEIIKDATGQAIPPPPPSDSFWYTTVPGTTPSPVPVKP